MPEGDTIHRAAAALRQVIVGHALTRFEAPRLAPPFPPLGTEVVAVDARGKHLLIRFADGHVLHTHMRMTGSWHLYRDGERWRRPWRQVRAVVGVDGAVAVCFNAPVVELLDDAAVARHPALRRLGPDLCLPDPDLDAAVDRMGGLTAERSISDALLDQRVAAGIGNVYRCEVCFVHGVHPATPLGRVDAATRRAMLDTAAALLRRNLDLAVRTTVPNAPPGSTWVYDRSGKACRRCGDEIATATFGDPPRITYWCPTCQPAQPAGSAAASGQ